MQPESSPLGQTLCPWEERSSPRFPADALAGVLRSFALASILVAPTFAQKAVYIPQFVTRDGVDVTKPDGQWSNTRKMETANYVIFWEPGFGSDPSTASGAYRVDMEALKKVAEHSFATNVDTLKMVLEGSSKVDQYKQMIFLLYQTDWAAYGSGQDEMVGTLHVNPAAANIPNVLAHEIGHCFQYMTGADVRGSGYRWGFGTNGAGGNGYWEQMAQWAAFQAYPATQFTEGDFGNYLRSHHLHILHEEPRYANYFLGDWWAFKRGLDFQGKLWRGARTFEDPVDTYKRLTGVDQETFNDEMWEHAARLTTWDLPRIKVRGANFIDRRAQPKFNGGNGTWTIDSSTAPENYGYNSIKLNAPANAATVRVTFQGLAGTSGFRSLNVAKGGWRFGFVALLKDGTRVYGAVAKPKMSGTTNPLSPLDFEVPANCTKLWLVVSGAPQEHWHHVWDDDDTNDERWPYKLTFANTNLLGQANMPPATGVERNPGFDAELLRMENGVLSLGSSATRAEILDARGHLVGSLGGGSPTRSIAMSSLPRGVLIVRTRSSGTTETASRVLVNTRH